MPFVIAITGASGSGKTTLARQLADFFPDSVSIMAMDNYYYGRSLDDPLENYLKRDFDAPEAINLDLFYEDLSQLKNNRPILAPFYDMQNGFISYPQKILIQPNPIIIVEGVLLFSKSVMDTLADLKVYIKIPTGIALSRKLLRDISQRNLDPIFSIRKYETHLFSSYQKYIKTQKRSADIIVESLLKSSNEDTSTFSIESSNRITTSFAYEAIYKITDIMREKCRNYSIARL